jgi:arginase
MPLEKLTYAVELHALDDAGWFVVRIVGAPFNSSGLTNGVARAPAALRSAGLTEAVGDDAGDVDVGRLTPARDPASGLLAVEALATTTASVASAVASVIGAGEVPLVVGGDCAVLLGALRGASASGLLFVDGHEDAWPPALSTTGECADSELGLALGRHRDRLPAALTAAFPTLDPATTAVLGPRDDDELARYSVPRLEGLGLWAGGSAVAADPAGFTTRATAVVGGRWWFHVDLDVLSTAALPAVDYPQDGGLGWEHLEEIAATALDTSGCVGVSLCIYNPDLDPDGRHARRIVSFAGLLAARL